MMANNTTFTTTNGFEIHLFPITIELGQKAVIKYISLSSMGMMDKTYILEGEEYALWGNDDNFIKDYICRKETIFGSYLASTDNMTPTIPIMINDNRSIHNEADVAKIETLQIQLDEQQKKLKTITDLLINKGMI